MYVIQKGGDAMRAPFDREIDLYWGPTTATPYAVYELNVPARLVHDVCFVDTETPMMNSVAYFTMDMVEPRGPEMTKTGDWLWDWDLGDACLVASVAGGEIDYIIVRVESRTWPTGEPYWRAHVVPYEEPVVGCEEYWLSAWSLLFTRSGPMSWGTNPYPMTTDGDGNWLIFDMEDDLHWVTSGWDGHGSATFHKVEDPAQTVDVQCVDAPTEEA